MASFMADQLSFLIGTSINVFSPEDATIKFVLSQHLPSLLQYWRVKSVAQRSEGVFLLCGIKEYYYPRHTYGYGHVWKDFHSSFSFKQK